MQERELCGSLIETVRGVTVLAAAVGFASACSRHVALSVPDTSHGARYSCNAVESSSERGCVPATTDVPAELNQARTSQFILPTQCAGKIHKIVIIDADSSSPKLDVTCAPEETPLEEMSSTPAP